jgi:hypothetical protein
MPNQQSQITIEVPVCFPVVEANRDFVVLGYALVISKTQNNNFSASAGDQIAVEENTRD